MSATVAGSGGRDSGFVTPQPPRRMASRILTATMPIKEATEANSALAPSQSPASSPLRAVLPRPRSQSAAPSFNLIAGLPPSPRPSPHRSPLLAPHPSPLRSSLSSTALFASAAQPSHPTAPASSLPCHRPSIVPQLAEQQRQSNPPVPPHPPAAPNPHPTSPASPPSPHSAQSASPSQAGLALAAQCAVLTSRLREREEELLDVRRELVEAREEVTTYRAMKEWREEEKGREAGGWQREKRLLMERLERLGQQQTTAHKKHEDDVVRLTSDIHTLLATIDQQHTATQQLDQQTIEQHKLVSQLQSQLLVHETNLTASTTRESLLQQSIQQLIHQHAQRLTQAQSEHQSELASHRTESEQTERLLAGQVAAVRVALLEAQADADVSREKRLKQARRHERLQQESRERVQTMETEREAERLGMAATEAEVEVSRARLAAMQAEQAEQMEQSQQERAKLSALLMESRHQFGELTSTNRKLQAELDIWQAHKEQDAKTHQLQLQQLDSQLARAQQQLHSAQQDYEAKLATQQLDRQQQLQQHQAELAHLNHQLTTTTQQLTTLQSTHHTLHNTHHAAVQQHTQSAHSLQAALSDLEQRCGVLTEERDRALYFGSAQVVASEATEGAMGEVRRRLVGAEDEARRWQEELERAEAETGRARADKVRERLEAERRERKARDERDKREWLERVSLQGDQRSVASPQPIRRVTGRRPTRLSEYSSGAASSSREEKEQIDIDSSTS